MIMAKDDHLLDALAAALLGELPDFAAQERAVRFLSAFAHLLEQDADVRSLFAHARKDEDAGMRCLRERLGKMADAAAINAIAILMRRGMADTIPLFVHRLKEQWVASGQGREANIASAAPLEKNERDQIRGALEKRWRMPVMLTEETDASLLGGFRIRSGDWRYDASMKGKILALKKSLI